MSFTDDDLKRLNERMNRIVTLWDSERKDHFNKCRTLDVAFREATEVFNALGPLLARLEAAERALMAHCTERDKMAGCAIPETIAWRKAAGK